MKPWSGKGLAPIDWFDSSELSHGFPNFLLHGPVMSSLFRERVFWSLANGELEQKESASQANVRFVDERSVDAFGCVPSYSASRMLVCLKGF